MYPACARKSISPSSFRCCTRYAMRGICFALKRFKGSAWFGNGYNAVIEVSSAYRADAPGADTENDPAPAETADPVGRYSVCRGLRRRFWRVGLRAGVFALVFHRRTVAAPG